MLCVCVCVLVCVCVCVCGGGGGGGEGGCVCVMRLIDYQLLRISCVICMHNQIRALTVTTMASWIFIRCNYISDKM